MLAHAEIHQAELRPSCRLGLTFAGRTPGEWTVRLAFVLCCAMVILMTVHGDDRGRRPRFVWRSFEDTIKIAKLQTIGDRTGDAADVAPPAVALIAAVVPLASSLSLVREWAATAKNQAAKAAYLLPFGNGPPSRA